MSGRVLIFCGIPGSGKTTVARIVAERLPNAIHVQTDNVRTMLAHPSFSSDESRFVYDGCFAVAREALRGGYTVLLDGTFMREEYRAAARSELRRYAKRFDIVYVACSLQTALRRNAKRKARVPAHKVRTMHSRFQVPAEAIEVDASRMVPEAAAARVLAALR